jgi:GNAT superfamily N-acetyltransferase
MDIRELKASDLDDLLSLYTHLHPSDDPLPPRAQVETTWRRILECPWSRVFGGYMERRLVSSCSLTVIPNLTRGCRPYGVLENVVTHIDYRRRGYGRAVLRHAQEYAWQQGCYKILLQTGNKDEGTYRFYEASGFDRWAKQAFVAKPPQTKKDESFMKAG